MQERERKKESLTRSLSRNKFNMLEQLPALLYLLRVKHIFCFEWFHLFYVCFYQDKHCVVAFLMEGIWRFCSCSSLISHTDDDSHLCLDDLKFYPKFKAYLWILLICPHWAGKYPKKKGIFLLLWEQVQMLHPWQTRCYVTIKPPHFSHRINTESIPWWCIPYLPIINKYAAQAMVVCSQMTQKWVVSAQFYFFFYTEQTITAYD